jgi:hypothetical protein
MKRAIEHRARLGLLCGAHVLQGSGFFLTGVCLVIYGWAVIGMLLETYGFWLLFSGFFPTVLGFLRRLPFLGSVLDLPVLKTVCHTFTLVLSMWV